MPGAVSSLTAINSTSTMVAFGGLQAIGNAVMRLEVDEVELISGNWSNTGFTIPVCGAHPGLTQSWHALGSRVRFISHFRTASTCLTVELKPSAP